MRWIQVLWSFLYEKMQMRKSVEIVQNVHYNNVLDRTRKMVAESWNHIPMASIELLKVSYFSS